MIKTLHYSVNYHGGDIDVLEGTKYLYKNNNNELLLLIEDDINFSGLSDDLREELKEGIKHKNYIFVLG